LLLFQSLTESPSPSKMAHAQSARSHSRFRDRLVIGKLALVRVDSVSRIPVANAGSSCAAGRFELELDANQSLLALAVGPGPHLLAANVLAFWAQTMRSRQASGATCPSARSTRHSRTIVQGTTVQGTIVKESL
jgi:hypothetical protein